MSFRNTYVTEFLYKSSQQIELDTIGEALNQYGSVKWEGREGMGYFHGVIKDLNGIDTKTEESRIVSDLERRGVRIKIVIE